jgi:cytoskeleton protein RodZ
MGQGIGRIPAAPAVSPSAPGLGREPIGRYISQQRTLRGIDLDELAARTRIPRRSLERLEAGAFDHTPDGFSRGFVRTVAEAIGLDPDEAVARMRVEPEATRQIGMPRTGRVLAVAAGLALAALIALAVREGVFAPPPPHPLNARSDALPVRRDYVRALAAARGIAVEQLSARDAVIPAQPLIEEAPVRLAEAEPAPAVKAPSAVATPAAPLLALPTSTSAERVVEARRTPQPTATATISGALASDAPPGPRASEAESAPDPAPESAPAAAAEPATEPAAAPSPDAENRD